MGKSDGQSVPSPISVAILAVRPFQRRFGVENVLSNSQGTIDGRSGSGTEPCSVDLTAELASHRRGCLRNNRRVPMAWIKRKIETGGDDNADIVSGGIFVIATVATFAALYSLGM